MYQFSRSMYRELAPDVTAELIVGTPRSIIKALCVLTKLRPSVCSAIISCTRGLTAAISARSASCGSLLRSSLYNSSEMSQVEYSFIALMFCSFSGPPKILRLHGTGVPVQQGDERFAEALAAFDITAEQRRAVRSVVEVEVTRVSDSCGFVVPKMAYEGERDQLYRYADNRLRKEGPDAVRAYVTTRNAESIDGLTGLDPLVGGAAPVSSGRKL